MPVQCPACSWPAYTTVVMQDYWRYRCSNMACEHDWKVQHSQPDTLRSSIVIRGSRMYLAEVSRAIGEAMHRGSASVEATEAAPRVYVELTK